MKQINQLLSLAVVILLLTSCQGSGGKKDKDVPDTSNNVVDTAGKISAWGDENCIGGGNFKIDSAPAAPMIARFRSIYAQAGLKEDYWIDSCVISGFSRFLSKHPEFDGVRIYFGADNRGTSVILVPTKPSINSTVRGRHTDQWGPLVELSANCNPVFRNYNLDSTNQFAPLHARFLSDYRQENMGARKKDSLSEAVWFSSCVFNKMESVLSDPGNNLDGIRIYSAAYEFKDQIERPSQDYNKQSTVLFVATSSNSTAPGGHKDEWQALNKFLAAHGIVIMAAYNHGDLCPNNCNYN